ncbi:MAG: hypothetical protein KDH98_08540 [Calditrichaeota bacterium]|nr:hypothetical protein [Calditrichota bacterium]
MLKILNLNRLDNLKKQANNRKLWVMIAILAIVLSNASLAYIILQRGTVSYDALVDVMADDGTNYRGFFVTPNLVLTEAVAGRNGPGTPMRIYKQDGSEYNAQVLASGYKSTMAANGLGTEQNSMVAYNWTLIDIGESGNESYFFAGSAEILTGNEEIRLVMRDENNRNAFRSGTLDRTGPKHILWNLEIRPEDAGCPLILKDSEEVVAIVMDLNLSTHTSTGAFSNIEVVPIDLVKEKCEEAGFPF